MCKSCYLFAGLFLLYILAACAPAAPQIIVMPTLAVLPSITPQPTETSTPTTLPSATFTPLPSATNTPNLLETQIAELNATNVSSQLTLDALLTKSAPTQTPRCQPDTEPDDHQYAHAQPDGDLYADPTVCYCDAGADRLYPQHGESAFVRGAKL